MGMTADQLRQFIKETTIPLLKDTAGPMVAELVRESVEKNAAPAWMPELIKGLHGEPKPEVRKRAIGEGFARYVKYIVAGRNDKQKAADLARKMGDEDIAQAIEKSVEKAMSAGDPTGGGFLVPEQFSQDVIELLRPSGAVRSMGPETLPMPTGVMRIPKITSGATASYTGENTNATKSEVQTGQITLQNKKLISLVPMSNDLVRFSSPQADTIVRNDMIRAMAQREDQAFIRDDGTSATPKGLKNWIASGNKFTANSSVSLDNTTNDLGKALEKLMAANVPLVINGTQSVAQPIDVRPGWLFSPRTYRYLTTVRLTNGPYAFRDEMLAGRLWGFPYRVTSQIQETLQSAGNQSEVYFGGFAYAIIGEALGLIVDASQEAAYHDGSAVVSAFSQDQMVVRVIAEHDFALRYDVGFALIEGVKWGL